ncbi:hypothetical protein ACHMW6_09240 [Pseudoduganella sp. UC29_106]|uniref:hypothetical protein n=1 Tax=Pseudoduganella sp. UC29_106 TaxID=3374553 RepID=UPI003758155D
MKKLTVSAGVLLVLSACGGGSLDAGGGGVTLPLPPSTPPSVGCSTKAADLAKLQIFPPDSPWRTDISKAPLDYRSNDIISFLAQTNGPLFANFGSGTYNGAPIGMPFVVVCDQAPVGVSYRANSYDGNYGSESDPGPMPVPLDAPIEENGAGDSHVLVVDAKNYKLYELYNASLTAGGTGWAASSGAKFRPEQQCPAPPVLDFGRCRRPAHFPGPAALR